MTCRANVNRDGDRFDGVSPGFRLVDEDGPAPQSINPACCGAHISSPPHMPLVLLGPGGEYVRGVGPEEKFFPSRVGKLVLTNAHIARIGIADDAVVIRNARPGLEVDWNIPAAVGEAAQAIEQICGVTVDGQLAALRRLLAAEDRGRKLRGGKPR